MHFVRVNVTFYDAVNVIHDVVTSANPLPYTAKFIFDRFRLLEIIKLNKSDAERQIEYVYSNNNNHNNNLFSIYKATGPNYKKKKKIWNDIYIEWLLNSIFLCIAYT